MFSLQYHFLDLSKQLFDFMPHSFLYSESTWIRKRKRYSMFKRTTRKKMYKLRQQRLKKIFRFKFWKVFHWNIYYKILKEMLKWKTCFSLSILFRKYSVESFKIFHFKLLKVYLLYFLIFLLDLKMHVHIYI